MSVRREVLTAAEHKEVMDKLSQKNNELLNPNVVKNGERMTELAREFFGVFLTREGKMLLKTQSIWMRHIRWLIIRKITEFENTVAGENRAYTEVASALKNYVETVEAAELDEYLAEMEEDEEYGNREKE